MRSAQQLIYTTFGTQEIRSSLRINVVVRRSWVGTNQIKSLPISVRFWDVFRKTSLFILCITLTHRRHQHWKSSCASAIRFPRTCVSRPYQDHTPVRLLQELVSRFIIAEAATESHITGSALFFRLIRVAAELWIFDCDRKSHAWRKNWKGYILFASALYALKVLMINWFLCVHHLHRFPQDNSFLKTTEWRLSCQKCAVQTPTDK